MGWDPEFLQQAVDTCTNLSGEISDCPLFTIQDSDVYNSCEIEIPSALVSEDVLGPMSTLPGNVAVQYGPGLAINGLTVGASGVTSAIASATNAVPTLGVSAGSTIYAASSQTYALGGVFDQVAGSVATSTSTSTTSVATTSSTSSSIVTSAPSISSAVATESFYSTQWTTTGNTAVEIFWVEETVTVTASGTPTPTLAAREANATPETDVKALAARHPGHAAKHLRYRRNRSHSS